MARALPSRVVMPRGQEPDDEDGFALRAFLEHVVPYEYAGGPISRSLLIYGVIGSSLLLATGLLALALPTPAAIHSSDFFWFVAAAAATVVSWMQTIAIPAVGVGLAMLIADLYLANGRHHESWRPVVGLQSVVGNLVGMLSVTFLAFVLFIIAVYMLLFILVVVAVLIVLWALALSAGG